MTGLEIWLLAIGLAMDCFAVSIASGIILKRTRWKPMLIMAFTFGLFQAIMPFIGWMFAKSFSHFIESIDHWIAFAILAFLGGRMIWESFKEEECCQLFNPTSLKVVFTMAVATSIDGRTDYAILVAASAGCHVGLCEASSAGAYVSLELLMPSTMAATGVPMPLTAKRPMASVSSNQVS